MNGENNVWVPPFVGEEHKIIVDDLVSVFNQVTAAQRPQWMHLVAPSGWGKTRIAREFYARLAADNLVAGAIFNSCAAVPASNLSSLHRRRRGTRSGSAAARSRPQGVPCTAQQNRSASITGSPYSAVAASWAAQA
jgi:H2-forming N5,N10-methylenetetrahydromethanopterin dehydrogenase-like enzyme